MLYLLQHAIYGLFVGRKWGEKWNTQANETQIKPEESMSNAEW